MLITNKIRDFIDEILLIKREFTFFGVDYFYYKVRSWKTGKKIKLILKIVIYLLAILLIIWGIITLKNYLYSQSWAGFSGYKISDNDFVPPKKLWDWLELILVPIMLAVIAYLFRKSEIRTSVKQANDQRQENALLSYFDFMQEILLMADSESNLKAENISRISRAKTLALLRKLDKERKNIVLRFLYEADLISCAQPLISLERADFSRIAYYDEYDYRGSRLTHINFKGSKLDFSDFRSCIMNDAILRGSSLRHSKLSFIHLNNADLQNSNLEKSDLYMGELTGVNMIKTIATKVNLSMANLAGAQMNEIVLSKAKLRKANLVNTSMIGAKLISANMKKADLRNADLTEANLMYANLAGADLSGANLTNAIISQRQLNKAKSTKNTNTTGIRDETRTPTITLTQNKYVDKIDFDQTAFLTNNTKFAIQ